MAPKHIGVFVFACFTIGIVCWGCEQTPEKKLESAKEDLHSAKQDLKEAVKDAQTAYQDEWYAFQFEMEARVRANEYRLNELKGKSVRAGVQAKAKRNTKLAATEQRNENLKTMLADYRDEGKEKWIEFKEHVVRDLNQIKTSLEELAAK